MRVLALSGCKTETAVDLAAAALPLLRARGLTVSVLLEGPPDFDLDRPGKDSYEHRNAGALEVTISSTQRWALLHEDLAPPPDQLIARLGAVDLLLVLGFDAAGVQCLQVAEGQDAAALAAAILETIAETPVLTQRA